MRSRNDSLPSREPSGWEPIGPSALPGRLAGWLAGTEGLLRVAVDGAPCADPAGIANTLIEPLRALGRPAVHIAAAFFWKDASLRLEHGRTDVESYRDWLDAAALRREVLDAVGNDAVDIGASYLPSLRDPITNRSTRAAPVAAPPGFVLVVSGAFLLGRGLPFDRTIHLAMSAAARSRLTADGERWTLPVFDAYDRDARPGEIADVVVKLDDPRRPAVRGSVHAHER